MAIGTFTYNAFIYLFVCFFIYLSIYLLQFQQGYISEQKRAVKMPGNV